MERPEKLISLNIDLPASGYDLAHRLFTQKWREDNDNPQFIEGQGLTSAPSGCDIHVALFFERTVALGTKTDKRAHECLRRSMKLLELYQIKRRLVSICLVDCGPQLSAPMSDFSVVRDRLETIAEYVSPGACGRLFTVDFHGDLEIGHPRAIYDTALQSFRDHVADHVNESLSSINTKFGAEKSAEVSYPEAPGLDDLLDFLEKNHYAAVQ